MVDETPTQPAEASAPRLRWEMPIWVIVSGLVASIPVYVAGEPGLFLYTLVPALLLTVIMLMVPSKGAGKVGVVLGVLLVAACALSVLTADAPTAAVIAMTVVVYLMSLPTNPALRGLSNLVVLAYLVFAWLGPPALKSSGADAVTVIAMTAVAAAITVAVVLLTTWLIDKFTPEQAEVIEDARRDSGVDPDARPSLAQILGPANPMFRYALVRSLTLGLILAVTFSQRGDESGFWVLLAMVIVSQPTGHAAWRSGVQRTVATLAGVVVFLIFLAVLPESALLAAALVAVLTSLLWVERNSTVVTACSTILVIALAGIAQSDYTDWAYARLLDTAIGAVIGVLVSVVGESRPRPTEADAAAPDDA